MAGKASRDGRANGQSLVAPDPEGTWASPPTGSRAPDRSVPAAAPDGAEVWLTPPVVGSAVSSDVVEVLADEPVVLAPAPPVRETVEWIEIVEDLQRDVVEARVEPAPEPARPPQQPDEEAPATNISSAVALVPAARREPNLDDDLVAVNAVLRISLEPEWPGNVHFYDITVDARDGTFIGAATRSSNVPGETIRGVFSPGFVDIDFIAVYPGPTNQYAWFGSGRLRRFTGSDSRGNVFHTASARVTNLEYVSEDLPADEPTVPVPEVTLHGETDDERADQWFDEEPVDLAKRAEPDAVEPVEPVEPVVEVAAEPSPDPTRDHPETCRCVACASAKFAPVAVTAGPLAGKAFYFHGPEDVPA